MKGHRTGRLGEEIKKIVGAMLITEVKDPRLQGKIISVTDVDVSRDGSYATCYVSVMAGTNDKTAEEEAVEGLRSATGLFRKEIGKQVKLRRVPELTFKIDNSLEYGLHIENVIKGLDIKPEEEVESPEEDGEDE
ncbi:MAG: 30S ribosome-binding factor RbfA [Firmicutes bacterium]|nr:30S ribosome-binding factor RbfA [Bacillota bacterium]